MRADLQELQESVADLRRAVLGLDRSKVETAGALIRATHALDMTIAMLTNLASELESLRERERNRRMGGVR